MKELIKNLEELNRKAEKGGGDARIEKQHSVGKLTARERIELLLAAKETAAGKVPVILNVAEGATRTAIQLAQRADAADFLHQPWHEAQEIADRPDIALARVVRRAHQRQIGDDFDAQAHVTQIFAHGARLPVDQDMRLEPVTVQPRDQPLGRDMAAAQSGIAREWIEDSNPVHGQNSLRAARPTGPDPGLNHDNRHMISTPAAGDKASCRRGWGGT